MAGWLRIIPKEAKNPKVVNGVQRLSREKGDGAMSGLLAGWRGHGFPRERERGHAGFAVQEGLLSVLVGEGQGGGEGFPLLRGAGQRAEDGGHRQHHAISRQTELGEA